MGPVVSSLATTSLSFRLPSPFEVVMAKHSKSTEVEQSKLYLEQK